MQISGCSFSNCSSASVIPYGFNTGTALMETWLRRDSVTARIVLSISSCSRRIRRAYTRTCSPSGVSVAFLKLRSNSRVDSSFSSAMICLDSADCVMCSRFAAEVNWRHSETVANSFNCRIVMVVPPYISAYICGPAFTTDYSTSRPSAKGAMSCCRATALFDGIVHDGREVRSRGLV